MKTRARYPLPSNSGDSALKKMMLLATVVAVLLAAAATAPASVRSAKGSASGGFKKNKDFAGLVEIGGGRKM